MESTQTRSSTLQNITAYLSTTVQKTVKSGKIVAHTIASKASQLDSSTSRDIANSIDATTRKLANECRYTLSQIPTSINVSDTVSSALQKFTYKKDDDSGGGEDDAVEYVRADGIYSDGIYYTLRDNSCPWKTRSDPSGTPARAPRTPLMLAVRRLRRWLPRRLWRSVSKTHAALAQNPGISLILSNIPGMAASGASGGSRRSGQSVPSTIVHSHERHGGAVAACGPETQRIMHQGQSCGFGGNSLAAEEEEEDVENAGCECSRCLGAAAVMDAAYEMARQAVWVRSQRALGLESEEGDETEAVDGLDDAVVTRRGISELGHALDEKEDEEKQNARWSAVSTDAKSPRGRQSQLGEHALSEASVSGLASLRHLKRDTAAEAHAVWLGVAQMQYVGLRRRRGRIHADEE